LLDFSHHWTFLPRTKRTP